MKNFAQILVLLIIISLKTQAQNYSFNFSNNGRRVCLVEAEVNLNTPFVTIKLLDAIYNTNELVSIFKRPLNGTNWTQVATNLPSSTNTWIDNNVILGEVWEYQIKRTNTWTYNSNTYDATGYTIGSLAPDNTGYLGRLILLVSNDIVTALTAKYFRLKKELTAEGWLVQELIVNRASDWNSGNEVVSIRNQIQTIYNTAPVLDKPKCIFILGHVPLPRSGSTNVIAPDDHNENKGARGCDSYYADIDGNYTDIATYNPGGLATSLAINLPNDFKWDQDFLPSDNEMAFGRVDFADITDYTIPEMQLLENYLDRLSNYKNVAAGFNMGNKTGFYFGYDNSNDGSYRSLPNISASANVYQNNIGAPHPQWVQNNGPFKIYMQNLSVPEISEWNQYGMNATVFSSDQSYWGFGDVPQNNTLYSRIRALLAANSKCLVTLWTTTGINIFHQACTGQPLGIAMKEIINHNNANQKLEKAPQEYDTEDWWNRTHFAFYGDPTLRLYQVSPPTNLTLSNVSGTANLAWTASTDPSILGYNIYKSSTELGIYSQINTSVNASTNFTIPNYQNGNWYMVKAIKMEQSGCGKFISPSIGVSTLGNIILPITLLNFTATKINSVVQLKWITANETNNSYFTIERSSNGISWSTLANVVASGTSTINKTYQHYDNNPLDGLNYYRLKQTDFNGNYKYFNVVTVNFISKESTVFVYPNPTNSKATVSSSSIIKSISILSLQNKTIANIENINNKQYNYIFTGLPKGVYVLKISTESKTEHIKIIVQ